MPGGSPKPSFGPFRQPHVLQRRCPPGTGDRAGTDRPEPPGARAEGLPAGRRRRRCQRIVRTIKSRLFWQPLEVVQRPRRARQQVPNWSPLGGGTGQARSPPRSTGSCQHNSTTEQSQILTPYRRPKTKVSATVERGSHRKSSPQNLLPPLLPAAPLPGDALRGHGSPRSVGEPRAGAVPGVAQPRMVSQGAVPRHPAALSGHRATPRAPGTLRSGGAGRWRAAGRFQSPSWSCGPLGPLGSRGAGGGRTAPGV